MGEEREDVAVATGTESDAQVISLQPNPVYNFTSNTHSTTREEVEYDYVESILKQ